MYVNNIRSRRMMFFWCILLVYRCDPGQTRISVCDEPSTTEWSTQAGHKARVSRPNIPNMLADSVFADCFQVGIHMIQGWPSLLLRCQLQAIERPICKLGPKKSRCAEKMGTVKLMSGQAVLTWRSQLHANVLFDSWLNQSCICAWKHSVSVGVNWLSIQHGGWCRFRSGWGDRAKGNHCGGPLIMVVLQRVMILSHCHFL